MTALTPKSFHRQDVYLTLKREKPRERREGKDGVK
jgi:hypothetical protein